MLSEKIVHSSGKCETKSARPILAPTVLRFVPALPHLQSLKLSWLTPHRTLYAMMHKILRCASLGQVACFFQTRPDLKLPLQHQYICTTCHNSITQLCSTAISNHGTIIMCTSEPTSFLNLAAHSINSTNFSLCKSKIKR